MLDAARGDARRRRCSGTVKVSSALVFDIGVYLVVVGLVLMVFEAFGDDDDGAVDAGRRPVSVRAGRSPPPTLFGIGTYLVLQRKLSRIIIGLGLLSHGANVLLITSGRGGDAPLIGVGDAGRLRRPAAAGARPHGHRDHASA